MLSFRSSISVVALKQRCVLVAEMKQVSHALSVTKYVLSVSDGEEFVCGERCCRLMKCNGRRLCLRTLQAVC